MTTTHEPNLVKTPALRTGAEGRADPQRSTADLPLFTDLDEATEPLPEAQAPEVVDVPAMKATVDPQPISRPTHRSASLTDRLGATLLDLTVMAAVAIVLPFGAALLGATPHWGDWPLFAIPWLLFSFLYYVVPMAFWGRTPGMALLRLTARSLDGGPLSFGQALQRWLSTLATVALAGLPGLLALSGRSATDRLSHSSTFWSAPESTPLS